MSPALIESIWAALASLILTGLALRLYNLACRLSEARADLAETRLMLFTVIELLGEPSGVSATAQELRRLFPEVFEREDRTMTTRRNPYPPRWPAARKAAWKKGERAALEGRSSASNPYGYRSGKRAPGLTPWAVLLIDWNTGFEYARHNRLEQLEFAGVADAAPRR